MSLLGAIGPPFGPEADVISDPFGNYIFVLGVIGPPFLAGKPMLLLTPLK